MKNLVLLLIVALTFTACKKEEQIEKNLYKGGGKWKIDSYHVKQVSPDPDESYAVTLPNAGTMTFNSDGSGELTIGFGFQTETQKYNYTNTENTLTLIMDGEPTIYKMDWKKNKMTLTYEFSMNSNNEFYSFTNKIELTKDK